jgi:hypothetical protein
MGVKSVKFTYSLEAFNQNLFFRERPSFLVGLAQESWPAPATVNSPVGLGSPSGEEGYSGASFIHILRYTASSVSLHTSCPSEYNTNLASLFTATLQILIVICAVEEK